MKMSQPHPKQINYNTQKQIKVSKMEDYKENSLKGSVVRSVYQSNESIEQLIQFFKQYQGNADYVNMNKLSNSINLKLKKYKESVYYGEFVNGKRHGEGIMIYNQNNAVDISGLQNLKQISKDKYRSYQGQWENDFKHGKGIQAFNNGTVYEGFYVNGKPEGIGRYSWPNGQFYQGQWLNGMKHGSGMWKGAKGDSYVGEWKFGKADGYGVHTWINGDRYQGQFKQSLKHGEGLQRFANGDIYKGFYGHGKPSGFGEYYWVNGSYFKGSFKTGLRTGQGIWKKGPGNSDKYEGEYLNDKKSGYGIFSWASGNIYKGNYQNDSRNGYGQMYWTDGSFYKGQWQNGIQHGRGQIYIPGQGVKKGIFQNNTLIHLQQEYSNYNELVKDQTRNSKAISSKSGGSTNVNKTKHTFRSRAYSTNNKNSRQNSRSVIDQGQARVFKLSSLKSNKIAKGLGIPGHDEASSFKSGAPISNNRMIRFGGSRQEQKNNRSLQSKDSNKQRIMHSAFYMHKMHKQLERGGGKCISRVDNERSLPY